MTLDISFFTAEHHGDAGHDHDAARFNKAVFAKDMGTPPADRSRLAWRSPPSRRSSSGCAAA